MRAVIAEDAILLRAGLVQLLQSAGIEVVGDVGDAESLLALLAEDSAVDLVITDVRMPPTHTDEGMRAALTIRQNWPDVAVLLLSQYVEERHAAKLLSGNTRGWATCSRTGWPTSPSS